MKKEERNVIVIGHKNPDTDSICSAIAYAEIKNRITNSHHYTAYRAGSIGPETEYVLNRFGVPVPPFIDSVTTQVKDMEIRRTPGISRETTIKDAWEVMGVSEAVTQPITEGNKVIGLITKGDIARAFMDAQDSSFLGQKKPRYLDIAATLDGRVVCGDAEAHFADGKVLIGAAQVERMREAIEEKDLVILVDREENQIAALEKGAGCLILCLGAKASEEVKALAEEHHAVIIETALDSFSASYEINKSVPVGAFMTEGSLITFKTEDDTEQVRRIMSQTRHRAFPVVDAKGRYVGTVSRRNLLGIRRKEVILVDHNEKSQAVDNIDDANILEIVDHHRLGTIQTLQPIYFQLEPVGCTATILYQMYVEKGIEIPPEIAGLLAAAIISDTLMFRSPTCTTQDKMAAGALAIIAGINIEEFANEMFEAGSDLMDKTPEEIFFQDYKKFHFHGLSFGVGQISSMSSQELERLRTLVQPILRNNCGKNGIKMVFFLLTDIRNASSELLYAGDRAEELVRIAYPDAEYTKDSVILPGVLSRKKQLIPAFMDATETV